jgi:hypothetical protein
MISKRWPFGSSKYPASAIPGVDLPAFLASRVGPVREASLTNPLENLVEFALVHEEGVVLGRDLAIGVDIVQRGVVAHPRHRKRADQRRRRETRISVKNFAAVFLSCAATIVWFNRIAITYSFLWTAVSVVTNQKSANKLPTGFPASAGRPHLDFSTKEKISFTVLPQLAH